MDDKQRTESRYHANGQLASLITFVNDLPDGPNQRWSENGTLVFSAHCRKGLLHGTVRSWNASGDLLGECEFCDGTGVFLRWAERGQLLSQVCYVRGVLHGPLRVWGVGGELAAEEFYIQGKRVSKKKYLAAAESDPLLAARLNDHKPESSVHFTLTESPKPPAGGADADTAVGQLLADAKEARVWLTESPEHRSIGEDIVDSEAIELVERLYGLGASVVYAVDISEYDDQQNTGTLVVGLPTEKAKRRALFEYEALHASERGFDGEPDRGQKYMMLRFD